MANIKEREILKCEGIETNQHMDKPIESLDDERLKFIAKDERKEIRKKLKARKQTQVKFKGKYARESKRGNSLIIHINKEEVPEKGLHLTIRNEDLDSYLEDATKEVPLYEIVSMEDEIKEN